MAEDEGLPDAAVREKASEEKAAEDRVQEALQTGAVGEAPGLPEHLRHLPERNQAQEIELKRRFAEQEWAGEHWHLSTAVIDVWLAATVVQVVGIVLVVTRNLFPDRDGKPAWL
jgi:hypothetical protein